MSFGCVRAIINMESALIFNAHKVTIKVSIVHFLSRFFGWHKAMLAFISKHEYIISHPYQHAHNVHSITMNTKLKLLKK